MLRSTAEKITYFHKYDFKFHIYHHIWQVIVFNFTEDLDFVILTKLKDLEESPFLPLVDVRYITFSG